MRPYRRIAIDAPNHSGAPRADDDLLFGEPPPDLGAVLSVTTQRKVGGRTIAGTAGARGEVVVDAMRRFVIAESGGAALAFLLLVALSLLGVNEGLAPIMLWGLGLGTAGGVVWFALHLRIVPACTWVCARGLVRATARGAEVLRFDDVADVRAAEMGGAVVDFGTLFVGPDGARLFLISGKYGTLKPPPAENDIHFSRAAREALERYRVG